MKSFIHRANERGIAEHGWLHSRFSFSFAQYHDRTRMGFGALRVINDDIIEPSGGFGMHPHRDMEIITIVLKGSLEHKDSEGNHDIIHAGEIQYMCAGSGIEHSEFNPSSQEKVELFQIWIIPKEKDLKPFYAKRNCHDLDTMNRWSLIVSGDGRKKSMKIFQDVTIKTARLYPGHTLVSDPIKEGHGRLLLVIDGEVHVCGHTLKHRDELQVIGNESFEITVERDAHLILFDVPMDIL
ncbi:MAG: pirin family protein [Sulfuricurvum sp.]|nr:pirin family protein [Sulfuricurvum sp.]